MSSDLFRSLNVLSLEQAMALPYLTMRLAEEGMRVIRVENPARTDPNRYVGPEVLPGSDDAGAEQGMNAYYLPNNLGKQAITLDLGTDSRSRNPASIDPGATDRYLRHQSAFTILSEVGHRLRNRCGSQARHHLGGDYWIRTRA